jgi:hypothetical protein
VLSAEELFYEIKGLEKQLRNGVYGDGEDVKKLSGFKKEYASLEKRLLDDAVNAAFIDKQLTGVEPGFQTLQPKMEVIAERLKFTPDTSAEGQQEKGERD